METLELIKQIEYLYTTSSYGLVFAASLIEISPFGFLIPGAFILAGAGFYAQDATQLILTSISASAGAFSTFIFSYLLGQRSATKIAKKLRQEDKLKRAEVLLRSHATTILPTSLLAPPLRFWITLVAGSQRYRPWKFFIYAAFASVTWSSAWIFLGYLAGTQRRSLEGTLAQLGIASWLLVILAVGVITWHARREYKK